MEFRSVDGSFVYKKDGKLYEVPMTPQQALNSSLMGIFQKRRFKNFLQWVIDVKADDPKTWDKCDLNKMTMKEVFSYWKCDENTVDFCGHAVALFQSDDYLNDPSLTLACIEKMQLYAWSLSKFEKSPYIYPQWGLGGLPEGFSRLAAVHGGVYMLRREIDEILYDKEGKVTGVKVKNEGKAYCKQLIGDPSYFFGTNKVKKTGTVARWLCILDHPVNMTKNSDSAQIILPCKQSGHRCDIYVSVMSSAMQVAPKNRWIAMISSYVFTNKPREELKVAYALLGKVLKELSAHMRRYCLYDLLFMFVLSRVCVFV